MGVISDMHFQKVEGTYTGVEVLLRLAERLLRDELFGGSEVAFWPDQGRLGDVSGTAALGES